MLKTMSSEALHAFDIACSEIQAWADESNRRMENALRDKLIKVFNRVATDLAVHEYIKAAGPAANPYYVTVNNEGAPWLELRTLFAQEMIRQGVLMPWMAVSYRHGLMFTRALR